MILDACFSGAGGRSVLAKGVRPLVTKVDISRGRTGRLNILTASQSDQITSTLESAGHGLFTYYLLNGLNGAAADASGHVTLKSLFEYASPKVQDEASRQNREQTPTLHTKTNPVLRAR